MAVLDKLESLNQLTTVEKEIVKYILEHKDQIIHLNISDLASMTDTSNATIIRLCRKLDLSGYKEFKIEFVKDLERRRKEKLNIDMSYPFRAKQSSQEIMKMIVELSKESLDSCYETVSSRQLEKVAEWISNANNTYIYGLGDSMISGISFSNRLMKIGKTTVIANQYGDHLAHTYQMGPKDVALFISYSGNSVLNKKYLKMMRRAGCKLVLISSNTELKDFDISITFPKREAFEGKMATYYSQTCINYILNSLYAMIFNLDFHKNFRIKNIVDNHL